MLYDRRPCPQLVQEVEALKLLIWDQEEPCGDWMSFDWILTDVCRPTDRSASRIQAPAMVVGIKASIPLERLLLVFFCISCAVSCCTRFGQRSKLDWSVQVDKHNCRNADAALRARKDKTAWLACHTLNLSKGTSPPGDAWPCDPPGGNFW